MAIASQWTITFSNSQAAMSVMINEKYKSDSVSNEFYDLRASARTILIIFIGLYFGRVIEWDYILLVICIPNFILIHMMHK